MKVNKSVKEVSTHSCLGWFGFHHYNAWDRSDSK